MGLRLGIGLGPAPYPRCAALTAGGARTLRRNLEWRDDASLFGAARRDYPGSAKAAYQLGDLLAQARLSLALARTRTRTLT